MKQKIEHISLRCTPETKQQLQELSDKLERYPSDIIREAIKEFYKALIK